MCFELRIKVKNLDAKIKPVVAESDWLPFKSEHRDS